MTRGFNAGRQLTGGAGRNNNSQQDRDFIQGGTAPGLTRAVVVDVIFDPTSLTAEQMDHLEDTVANPELVEGMPYNSILARVVSNSQDLGNPAIFIFYPMFPMHFQLPIKPGEQVLIMYEDYSRTGGSLGYWLTRPMGARQIEDVNYTHHDRNFDPYNHPRNIPRDILSQLTASAPTFPNGAGTMETYSLKPSGSTNPYNDIVTNATSSAIVTFEAIPRYKKRPGDLVIQGSNNAGIFLGQDRTGPALRVTGSAGKDIIEKAGTIDLVAGLGAQRKQPADESANPSEDNHNPTSARVIQNARSKKEVFKTPYKKQQLDNPKEGDPDFLRDLSRVYVSMKTKGDKNFKINMGGEGGIFTASGDKLIAALADLPADEQNGQPFIIAKSEQIRLIAKGKDDDNGPSEHGEIRLIKEGKVADKDLSLFVMTKEGRVVMVGKDIQMQTHDDGKVLLRCKTAEPGDSDPVVLYSHFEECITKIADQMLKMRNSIGDQVGTIKPSAVNACGPFSPIPGLISIKVAAPLAKQQIKDDDATYKRQDTIDMIAPCKSKWVFVNKENQ